jgi:hypothetical protein
MMGFRRFCGSGPADHPQGILPVPFWSDRMAVGLLVRDLTTSADGSVANFPCQARGI